MNTRRGAWTPARRAKFKATLARKRAIQPALMSMRKPPQSVALPLAQPSEQPSAQPMQHSVGDLLNVMEIYIMKIRAKLGIEPSEPFTELLSKLDRPTN